MNIEYIVKRFIKCNQRVVHYHDIWELILVCSGKGFVVVDEVQYPVSPGAIICIPPAVVHYNVALEECTHIAIRVKGFNNPSQSKIPVFHDDNEKTVQSLAEIALQKYYSLDVSREEVVGLLCDTIYAVMVSSMHSDIKSPEVERVKNKMITNFADPSFSIAQALSDIHYSEAHFRKLFHEEMGETPGTYLGNLRLDYAKKLLEKKGKYAERVSDISYMAGFNDYSYFVRRFRQKFGVTPQKYREGAITTKN